jgi:CheY-like chemotaxis protein
MPKKILLADDSITIQKVVELTFSDGDYEVYAVNNGAKAIEKLSEFTPDIILSDIIMPEKNGYEVCEYVKSHAELKAIPVILLTGTFEPFDPDRAEKAGCDAVVTKPFESQNLIHKVEELIAAREASVPEPEPEPQAAEPAWQAPAEPEPQHDEVFGQPAPTIEQPVERDDDAFGGYEPPKMSTREEPFETGAGEAAAPEESDDVFAGAPEPTPIEMGGETKAFPQLSHEELLQLQQSEVPPPPPPSEEEPPAFAQEDAPVPAGETRAFPMLDPDEIMRMQQSQPEDEPLSSSEPEPLAADEEQPIAMEGETRAFPMMSFEEMQQMQQQLQPEPSEPEPEPEPIAEEPPIVMGGETRAFPMMSFDEMQQLQQQAEQPPLESEPPASPMSLSLDETAETEPEPEPTEPEPSALQMDSVPEAWPSAENEAPMNEEPPADDLPAFEVPAHVEPEGEGFAAEPEPGEAEPPAFDVEPSGFASEPEPEAEPRQELESVVAHVAAATVGRELTTEQLETVARRVVEMLSDDVVRKIAWEVIPEVADMVVRERIKELENEES